MTTPDHPDSPVSARGTRNFKDDRHNLYVGWVAGLAIKHGVLLDMITDDIGNYTARLAIEIGGKRIEFVVPYPPDDWTLTDE